MGPAARLASTLIAAALAAGAASAAGVSRADGPGFGSSAAPALPAVGDPSVHPGRRSGALLVGAGDHLLLHGGRDESGAWRGDTWGFSQGAWSVLAAEGPGIAFDAAARDPRRGVVVFHGGSIAEGEPSHATWEWTGRTWARSPAAPAASAAPAAPTSGACLAWDEATGSVLLVGGRDAAGSLSSGTWSYDGRAWTHLASSAPPPRVHAAMSEGPRGRGVVLCGGFDEGGAALADCWRWNGRLWRRLPQDGPPARGHHAMARDAQLGLLVLFGGSGGSDSARRSLGDTWLFNGRRWVDVPGRAPSARRGAVLASHPEGGVALLGGRSEGGALHDAWTLREATWAEWE